MNRQIKINKRGLALSDLQNIALVLVVVAGVFVGGFLALDSLSATLTANSYAANSTGAIEEAMYNITSLLPTTGTIIGVAVFLGILIAGFAFARSRNMV